MPSQPPPRDPAARHTDQCLLDYARFGFCEHTLLQPGQPVDLIESRPLHTPNPRHPIREGASPQEEHDRRTGRELVRWVGFLALLAYTYLVALTPDTGFLKVTALIVLPAVGWLIVFTRGLPQPIRILATTDFGKIIPSTARLDDLQPPRASKRSQRKRKGPSS